MLANDTPTTLASVSRKIASRTTTSKLWFSGSIGEDYINTWSIPVSNSLAEHFRTYHGIEPSCVFGQDTCPYMGEIKTAVSDALKADWPADMVPQELEISLSTAPESSSTESVASGALSGLVIDCATITHDHTCDKEFCHGGKLSYAYNPEVAERMRPLRVNGCEA